MLLFSDISLYAYEVMTLLSNRVLPRARIDASEVHSAMSRGATQNHTLM